MEGLIVAAVFAVLVVVTIVLGVRLVPQGSKHVVQRLGKYHKTLGPGLNIIIPYIDTVAYKVTTKDIVLDIPSQEVITRDNASVTADGVVFFQVLDAAKASYEVNDLYRAILQVGVVYLNITRDNYNGPVKTYEKVQKRIECEAVAI